VIFFRCKDGSFPAPGNLKNSLIKKVINYRRKPRFLASFAVQTGSHANIIRFNPPGDKSLLPPESFKVNRFKKILKSKGIRVSERYRRGEDIQAACGQLWWHQK